MILDKLLMFSDDQAVTSTANSTDTFPLTTVGKIQREHRGEAMEVVVQVTETFATGTSATLSLSLVTGNTSALGSPILHYSTPVTGVGVFAAGRKIRFPLAFSANDSDATHLGLTYTVGTGTFTAGKVTAWIQRAGEDQNSFDSSAP